MKNYEWINNMAKVDLLYLIESNWAEGRCIVNQLNNNDDECFKKFRAALKKDKDTNTVQLQPSKCYECICNWLNTEHGGK